MKIKAPNNSRILFDGEDMLLTEYCNDDNVWLWKIIGYKSSLIEKGFIEKKEGSLYTLSFPKGKKYHYSAYEAKMYCMYKNYKYHVENIWNGLFILYPEDQRTRKFLKYSLHNDSRLEIPYDDLIASFPVVWEERKPIVDFVFDVQPLVYLYKDGSYVEENLHGAWYNKNNALK